MKKYCSEINNIFRNDKTWNYMAGILGGIIFVLIYGIHILNPCYVDWLLERGDLTQHYLGWEFFKKSDWLFPIGLTNQIAYPNETSVIFTDSIPLMAIPFKLLRNILPTRFQYFGWWGLMCFTLQGFFAAKIMRTFKLTKVQALISSVFFVISPVVIDRMFRHTSLGGQWIILLSIYLYIKHKEEYKNILVTSMKWGVVGILIASIHLYFLPMCGIFVLMYVIKSYIAERKWKITYTIPLVTFLLGVLSCTYIFGGFSSQAETGSWGLGELGFNLNGFFNSMGYSKVLPALEKYCGGQIEGFAYLGIGILGLTAIAIFLLIKTKKTKLFSDILLHKWDFIFIILVLTIFSSSPSITFGDKLIFEIPCSEKIAGYWAIFRSTGREIWPVYYLLMIFSILYTCRLISKKECIPTLILILGLSVQIWDLSGKLTSVHNQYDHKVEYQKWDSGIWKVLSDRGYQHVVYASPGIDIARVMNLAEYALENNMTMSNFYFARNIDLGESTQRSLEEPDEKSIYVFLSVHAEYVSEYDDIFWYETDGYFVGVTEPVY